jgi:hypothetical protein
MDAHFAAQIPSRGGGDGDGGDDGDAGERGDGDGDGDGPPGSLFALAEFPPARSA